MKRKAAPEVGDVVKLAKERFQQAQEAYSANRILARDDLKFAMGDSDNGWQWPEGIRDARKNEQRVCLTVNMTAQHCNQIINNIRQNRPQVKVLPSDSGSDKKTAEILGGLIRNTQAASSADDAHDCAAEHAIYGGEGYWRIVTEFESPTSFNQVIRIVSAQNPNLVFIDPNCREMDKSDADWGFLFEDISKEQCTREHGDIDATSWDDSDQSGWVNKESVRRAIYYTCEYKDDEALALSDGSTVLKSAFKPGKDALGFPLTVVKNRPTRTKSWKMYKLLGGHDKPVEETDWLGEYLPIVAVIGKEMNVNGEIVRKGIVRDLKDPARMVNFSYSETVQTLALQNKIPYMAAAEAIEGHEDVWDSANLQNRAYLPWNALDESGNPLPKPERQAPAIMPAAQVQLLQLSTEQMRAASGQQNSNFGIKSEASSGIGIQRLKVQGETATFHFPDNLRRALQYEAKVLIDLYQKYYDTKRVVRILGLDGTEQKATLDPELPQAYQEHDDVEADDIQKIFNPTVGKYDVTIDTGPSFQTQRQESFTMLSEIASRNPQLMTIAGDLIMRASDIPMADQIATRLEKALAPGLLEKRGATQIPPEVQQQTQQMQEQVKQLSQALENAHSEVDQLESQLKAKQDDSQAKAALAEHESALKHDLAIQAANDRRVQLENEAQLKREQADIDAQALLEKAKIDAEAKIQIAIIEQAAQAHISAMQPTAQSMQAEESLEPETSPAFAEAMAQISEAMAHMSRPRQVSISRGPDGSLNGSLT